LLCILINTGTQNRSALDISRDLLSRCQQNLMELGKMNFNDLKQFKGLGEKKAITLLAAMELGRRRQMEPALERPRVHSSQDSFRILQPYFLDEVTEMFYVLFLNAGNRLVHVEAISKGGLTATVVDSRIVFRRALELGGITQLIISHNHPSGNLNPSEMDKRLTQKIKDGGALLDLALLDHLIIYGNQYFSFRDEGLL
ncbi:MAG TPA: DNA repair protein RadC, partial [Chitinophagaceae bacterium]|nr:DNA repair protein RadC [Chitinophagaceae bacterium]